MEFSTWSTGNKCAAANIIPGAGRQIWGSIFEVPDWLMSRDTCGDRKSMDGIEGRNYRRELIHVRRNDTGEVVDVSTYVVVTRAPNIQTSKGYSVHILGGLAHIGAPPDYIEYVKERVAANNPALESPPSSIQTRN